MNACEIHISFSYAKDQNVFYPSVESIIEYAKDAENEEKANQEEKPNIEVCEKLLAEVDNLYEAHEQVSTVLVFQLHSKNEIIFFLLSGSFEFEILNRLEILSTMLY